MNRYGKLVDNTIDAVTEAEDRPGPIHGNWVLCGGAGPGWTTVDEVNFVPPAAPPGPRILSKIDYALRFTSQERIDIRTAATTDDVVNDYVELLRDSQSVNLDDQHVVDALNYLELHNKIGAGRAAAIRA